MIDPLVSLAFALHSHKGVYALLLGSGVSGSAGIPTGWQVTLDLARKLAHVQGEQCEPDPAAWYTAKYDEEPDYSKLLNDLAKTPSERNGLLRGYFEPTEEEREQGKKVPTPAHRAIARLVASGHIRVILTTNFDQLMENALRDQGIVPTVISTPDAAQGAPPLVHTRCTVIKLHGDYLDTRIKNTPKELSSYRPRTKQLLARVLDEYGLVICGWSGDWDTALCAEIERCKSRRYTTVWAARGTLGDTARRLIEFRAATVVDIKGADAFFQELAEKVAALEEFDRPHPLSTAAAVTALKKYIPDPQKRILLESLVSQETEKLADVLAGKEFVYNVPPDIAKVAARMKRYESASETLLALMAAGCYWGEANQCVLWGKVLERIVNAGHKENGYEVWADFQQYPALMLFYAGGMTAIAANRYDQLRLLLMEVKVRRSHRPERMVAEFLTTGHVLDTHFASQLPGLERHHTPISNRLHQVLRGVLKSYAPDDDYYDQLFDRFEYFCSLVMADLHSKSRIGYAGMIGRFAWRWKREDNIAKRVEEEVRQVGQKYPPLVAGLFGGSRDRFAEVKAKHDESIAKLDWW